MKMVSFKRFFGVFAVFVLFAVLNCTPPGGGSPDGPVDLGYTINGDVAEARTTAGLTAVLLIDSVKTINLKSSVTYGENYSIIYTQSINGNNSSINGSLTVAAENVVLSDLSINDNLRATAAVGDSNLTLNNVNVNGETILEGGGSNSVKVKGTSNLKGKVSIKRAGLRIAVEPTVSFDSEVSVEASGVSLDSEGIAPQTSSVFVSVSINTTGAVTIKVPVTAIMVNEEADVEIRSTVTTLSVQSGGTVTTTSTVRWNCYYNKYSSYYYRCSSC